MAQRTGLEEITPELVGMMAEYFGINEEEALQKLLYAQASKMRDTQMPEMRRYGDNHVVAPNPMEVAAAAIKQYRGGEGEASALAKIQAGLLRKKDINTAGMQADMARRRAEAEPPALQPDNGAMMSPDPSTMTSEAIPFAETPPWEEPFSRGVRTGSARSPLTDTSPQRGRGYAPPVTPVAPGVPSIPGPTQSPLYGWRDIMGLFGRK